MAVSVKTEPSFNVVEHLRSFLQELMFKPTELEGSPWDIHPDGNKFLMMKPPVSAGATSPAEGPRKINIVLNWFEELKQRVPVK